MTSMILATIEQLKQSLKTQLPAEAKISSVELEGPFLVVYSRRPEILMEDGTTIKNLAIIGVTTYMVKKTSAI